MLSDEMWDDVLDTSPLEQAKSKKFVHAVRVDVGVGKSHAARQHAADLLAAMRKRGDKRTVVIAVPTHRLGDEQVQLFEVLPAARDANLTASVWRGRSAPDPAFSDDTLMCQDIERVRDAQSVGLDVQSAVCKRRMNGDDGKWHSITCPFFGACGYQLQRERRPDLWVVPHELIFGECPTAIGEIASLIVDEAAWPDGLEGVDGRPITLALDALAGGEDVFMSEAGMVNRMSSERLRFLRGRLLEAFRKMPDGPIARAALSLSVLTDDSAAEAYKLEWRRKLDPRLDPGMTRHQRRKAIEAVQSNTLIPRFASLWAAVRALLEPGGPEASGWASLATVAREDGNVRVLRLKGRKQIREGWDVPTLVLDAVLPIDLVRFYWPTVELVADVKAAAPFQHVRQVVDRAFAKSMLEPLAPEFAASHREEARRRGNRLRDLRAILIREARRYSPGRVLIVAQKGVREALTELGPMPPNVDLAHHNAVAGRDEWRNVAALIVVGRTMPSPAAVERISEALTGRATPQPIDWYDRADAVREMADGSTVLAEADRHPDPVAEAIRWQICEGELVQIIGRARGANRTEADPVDVLVLTDVPLPVPLASVLGAAELAPSVADLMLAAGGVVLKNARHAALAYPCLWASYEAAKKALQRERTGTFPYRYLMVGECPPPRVSYQVKGAGQKEAAGSFAPDLCPNPEAFLTEKLGPLAWCRVDGEDLNPRPAPSDQTAAPSPSDDANTGDLHAWAHQDCGWPAVLSAGADLSSWQLESLLGDASFTNASDWPLAGQTSDFRPDAGRQSADRTTHSSSRMLTWPATLKQQDESNTVRVGNPANPATPPAARRAPDTPLCWP